MFVSAALEEAAVKLLQEQASVIVDYDDTPMFSSDFPQYAYSFGISDGTEFGSLGIGGTEPIHFYKGQSAQEMKWPCVILSAGAAQEDPEIPGVFNVPFTISLEIDPHNWTGQPDQKKLLTDAATKLVNLFQRDDLPELLNRHANEYLHAQYADNRQQTQTQQGTIMVSQLSVDIKCANCSCREDNFTTVLN